MNPDLIFGALQKPPRGTKLVASRAKQARHWTGRKHSSESKARMRQSAIQARATGSHAHLKKPVDRPTECLRCGGAFVQKSRNRILGKKYCGVLCQLAAMKAAAAARPEKQRTCRRCAKSFTAKWTGRTWQVFCSSACLHARPMVQIVCTLCGRVRQRLQVEAKRRKTPFCSRVCALKWNRGENSACFRPGGTGDPYRRGQTGEWKRLSADIRERDGHTCQRCNKVHCEPQRRFPVDHIVPWRSFEDKAQANHPSNLVTLCHQCHAWKTTTVERVWFKGDRIGMEQYMRSIKLPPLFASVLSAVGR